MSTGKTSRVTDGPYANWGADDEIGQISLANGATLKLGQPLCVDVTQLGPDNNVPNNGAQLALCERLVACTSGNAGPLFGVLTGITVGLPKGVTLTTVGGIPTWTNSSGAAVVLTVSVRQLGWAYVYAGTIASGRAVKIGDPLIITSANAFAVSSSVAIGGNQPIGQGVGTALGTAINTVEAGIPAGSGTVPVLGAGSALQGLGAPGGPGVISIVPLSLAAIQVNTVVLIDSLASGVQEAVSVGSISYPAFSVAVTNAHAGGFKITGPATNEAISTNLISVVTVTTTALVAAYVNCQS
jgi:hypothetical protein